MAALHTVTVTCPACAEPIQVPVVLTQTEEHGRRRGAFQLLVNVRADRAAIAEHQCQPDPETEAVAA